MAIYHFSVKPISRSNGRSATAAAAYRAGEKIYDERTGETFDYTRKTGILVSEIVTPEDVQIPEWATDRERLWNEAERAETRINSRVAREAEIALPHELSPEDREELARSLAQLIADRYKVPVDYSIHEPGRNGDDRNHHAHILFATREIDGDGFGKKTRVLDAHETGPDEIDKLRFDWAELVNRSFERAGLPERVDPRTLEAQGIDRDPTQHLGPDATALERKGHDTILGDFNRAAAQTPAPQDRASQPKPSGDLSRKERRELVTNLYSQSDGPDAFREALAENGFLLTTGDRRPFVLVDSAGATHNLARLIPDATNDSLREYFQPILEELSPAIDVQHEIISAKQDRLTGAFQKAAEPEPPQAQPITETFNKEAEPLPPATPQPSPAAPDPADKFFTELQESILARQLAEAETLRQKQEAFARTQEELWQKKMHEQREKLDRKHEAKRRKEDDAAKPTGLKAIVETVRDRLDPDRIEKRLQEKALLDAARQEREASERLALENKLAEILDKKREELRQKEQTDREQLAVRQKEEIDRMLREEEARKRIAEEYKREQERRARDITREDNERDRGRDR